jgi:long-chain acyl-CoA synthetase
MINSEIPEPLRPLPVRTSDIVKPWAQRSPENTALVDATGTWTYGQLLTAISQAQTWLVDLGARPGDRVMVVCENSRASVAIFLALGGSNVWPVLVNARLSPQEIDQIRDHCGARRLIYTVGVSVHAKKHALRHGATLEDVPGLGLLGIGPRYEDVRPESLEANDSDDVGALIYTSGTTGRPKGVMLSHRNLLFAAAVSSKIRALTPADRMYGVLPISHVAGLSVVMLATLLSGASLHLSARFDPTEVIHKLENEKITVMLGAPALFALLVDYAKHKGLTSLKYPSLRIISCAGAPLSAASKSEVEKFFGILLHNAYGCTECSPSIAQTRLEFPSPANSVGPVVPGVEVKLMGGDGQIVREGEVGEVWVRGPNVMKGYYRSPEETAASLSEDGWFNTRDLARFDNGNLVIAGRTKDMIIRFGFNVYPAEVEAVLNAHPEVERSAVVGRMVRGEEEVIAFVQLYPSSRVSTDELAKHAAQRLAPYKQPSQFILVGDMPLTLLGKVIKDQLLKRLNNSFNLREETSDGTVPKNEIRYQGDSA